MQDAGRALRRYWIPVALSATAFLLVSARRPGALARAGRGALGLLPALPYLYKLLRRR